MEGNRARWVCVCRREVAAGFRPRERSSRGPGAAPNPTCSRTWWSGRKACSADLAALSNRFILEPSAWPFTVGDEAAFADFLERAGVRRGLWPVPIPRSRIEADGRLLADLSAISRVPMSEESRELWRISCRSRAPGGLKPYTPYRSAGQQYRLPGQDDHANLSDAAKRGLCAPRRPRPPALAGLDATRHVSALQQPRGFVHPADPRVCLPRAWPLDPMSRPGDRNAWYYVAPSEAWSYQDADEAAQASHPSCPPRSVGPQTRHEVHARLSGLGLNYWDDHGTAPARVRLFATLLSQDAVPEGAVASFKKGYEDAGPKWSSTTCRTRSRITQSRSSLSRGVLG